jgi:hypothetical protein
MNRSIKSLSVVALTLVSSAVTTLIGTSTASAQDYGPDTCLQGYVWREAVVGDHVCVTPATRSQASHDNSQAGARRNPGGGPYGPDTCRQGYVWREAVVGDHVCVTPATRSQASHDNSQADSRRAAVKIWLTRWYPTPKCNGNTCTSTSTDGIPRFQVNGDHFNINSQVLIGFYRLNDHRLIKSYTLSATARDGFPGGSFDKKADVIDCSFDKKTPENAYVKTYDHTSGRWSNSIAIRTGCPVL